MKNQDWLEESLIQWGVWRATLARAEGFGGAASALDNHGRGDRPMGTHSDPVLAEYERSLKLHQGDSALLNRLLAEFEPRIRKIVFLRYVGEPVAITTKKVVGTGAVQTGEESYQALQMGAELPLHWDYSGRLPLARVAALVQVSEHTVSRTINRTKKQLRSLLREMARIRQGKAGEVRHAA